MYCYGGVSKLRIKYCLVLFAFLFFSGCGAFEEEAFIEVMPLEGANDDSLYSGGETLSVMTLNLAHGRGTRALQEFVSNDKTRENLDAVAELLERERIAVAAFQEADIKSHPQVLHGGHTKGLGFYHGTALISKLWMSDGKSVAFEPVLPSPDKGFVVCSVYFNGMKIDVVSVHLDFGRDSVRQEQVREMVDLLSARRNPLVVMGDFNCELNKSEEVYGIVKEGLNLSAYNLESEELYTFRLTKKRIDWILISDEFEFVNYRILDDKVSDHMAVAADLKIRMN
jgi:endonuclease/exonuclease/phosphatase family metal-dependent hydrolase